jgi:hypothetical protein
VALSRSGAHLSGFACIGSSNLSLAGFLAGNGATRAGMAYNLGVFGGESGSANGVIGYRLGSTQP